MKGKCTGQHHVTRTNKKWRGKSGQGSSVRTFPLMEAGEQGIGKTKKKPRGILKYSPGQVGQPRCGLALFQNLYQDHGGALGDPRRGLQCGPFGPGSPTTPCCASCTMLAGVDTAFGSNQTRQPARWTEKRSTQCTLRITKCMMPPGSGDWVCGEVAPQSQAITSRGALCVPPPPTPPTPRAHTSAPPPAAAGSGTRHQGGGGKGTGVQG